MNQNAVFTLDKALNRAYPVDLRRVSTVRLVEIDLLERRPIGPNSKRFEYVPTIRGLSLREPLSQLEAWGERECPLHEKLDAS